MNESSARNVRTAERFLLDPPLGAHFGAGAVSVTDISLKGARFRHTHPLEMGAKAALRLALPDRPLSLEAVVVWTQSDASDVGRFISGVRTYATAEVMSGVLKQLQAAGRIASIEELRGSERFFVAPTLDAQWGDQRVLLEDVGPHGARIETSNPLDSGTAAVLRFRSVEVKTRVVWSALKSLQPARHRAGLAFVEKGEMMRLAIGQLCEEGRAIIDTRSLGLKVKVSRARARKLVPPHQDIETSGLPAEQYILIQGVREELRLNPEAAMQWYRRARTLIKDPATRRAAPAIADHADALAVWEYLDRSIDPSIIGRAFQLPR